MTQEERETQAAQVVAELYRVVEAARAAGEELLDMVADASAALDELARCQLMDAAASRNPVEHMCHAYPQTVGAQGIAGFGGCDVPTTNGGK